MRRRRAIGTSERVCVPHNGPNASVWRLAGPFLATRAVVPPTGSPLVARPLEAYGRLGNRRAIPVRLRLRAMGAVDTAILPVRVMKRRKRGRKFCCPLGYFLER